MDIHRLLSPVTHPTNAKDHSRAQRTRSPPPQQRATSTTTTSKAHSKPLKNDAQPASRLATTTLRTYSTEHISPVPQPGDHTHTQHVPAATAAHKPMNQPPNIRTLSNRSLATAMDSGPTRVPSPRKFSTHALSEDDLNTVTRLLSYLQDNSYAYEAYVQLINLLHKGLVAHTEHVDEDAIGRPYAMLTELRQAREAMDSRFAVGEAIWLDWLADESALAVTSDARVTLTELFQKAVQDEPASVRIWDAYIQWLEGNYATCYDIDDIPHLDMNAEDKEVCRELFTEDMLFEVIEHAASAVQWQINASHVIWSRYLRTLLQRLSRQDGSITPDGIEQVFLSRMQTPHAAFEETKQLFWPIINRRYGEQYERAMDEISHKTSLSRDQMHMRNTHEDKTQAAIDSGHQQVVMDEFNKYLKWEKNHKHRAPFDKEIRSALYERALLYLPSHAEWWVEYIDYVISQHPSSHNPSSSVLPLIERATRHCPWSGELWSRRILRSDYERRSYDEIEATKHRATNSGLLDIGGMDDLLKVLVEWCSYLRRQAFTATASEDNRDMAEVGITMAIEDLQQAGKKLYGEKFEGDPQFRLEAILIKFLSEARRMEDARNVWRGLIPTKRNSYEFWMRYHVWEITLWIHDRVNDGERVETTETGPSRATAIAEEALSQHNLDWPEKIADMYVDHFQWHESVEKLQAATIAVSEFRRKIVTKRSREAEAAAQQQAQYQLAAAQEASAPQELGHDQAKGEKRKRQDGDDEDDNKKLKVDETPNGDGTIGEHVKRDRENLSVTITNLASEATEQDVRSILRGCGPIVSIDIAPAADGDTTVATIEFTSKEDADFAKSRSGRTLLGIAIHIQSGRRSALYVTNYPPEFDETSLRNLFKAYGNITSVRFPSLKFNRNRRFCYVQFAAHDQAKAAEAALDGKNLDGTHRLLARISNPEAKRTRDGAQAEGRELFVKNIDFHASEQEVREFFEQFGTVVSLKLLLSVAGKRLGSGFVVFETAEQAQKAVQDGNKPLRDRILQVMVSEAKGSIGTSAHAAKQDIIVKHDTAGSPSDSVSQNSGPARRGSDVSMISASSHDAATSQKNIRGRQVALLGLPDTVADARIIAEMEKHGRVVKLQLRRDQDAAIIEFEDVATAVELREGVEFRQFGAECRSGDTKELFAKRKKQTNGSAVAMRPAMVSRPARRGARRGGLGFKRGAFSAESRTSADEASKTPLGNADFKAIFEKGKKDPQDSNAAL